MKADQALKIDITSRKTNSSKPNVNNVFLF